MAISRRLPLVICCLCLLVLSLVAWAPPAVAQAEDGTKFRVSSLGNDVIQVQGAFEGTYTIDDGRLNLDVTYGVFRMLARPRFEARTASVATLRFGIAHRTRATADSKATFAVDARSAAQPVNVALTAGQDVPLTPYRTSIAIPANTPLTDRWLVAELALPVFVDGRQQTDVITAHPRWGVYLVPGDEAAPAPAPAPQPASPRPSPAPGPGGGDATPPRIDDQIDNQPANPANGSRFHFTSVGTPFAIQGDFRGVYRLESNRIVFDVAQAVISERADIKYLPNRYVTAMQFRLTRIIDAKKGAWDAVTRSEEMSLDLHLRPGERVSLKPFRIAVPIPAGTDLKGHWISIQLTDTFVRQSDGIRYDGGNNGQNKVSHGFAYVHGKPDIFK